MLVNFLILIKIFPIYLIMLIKILTIIYDCVMNLKIIILKEKIEELVRIVLTNRNVISFFNVHLENLKHLFPFLL